MKKRGVLNAQLSYVLATLGHTDEITLADAGLPIDEQVERVDLALTQGIPRFIDTLRVILDEVQVEGVILAEELPQVSPHLHQEILTLLTLAAKAQQQPIKVDYVPHQAFKKQTTQSRAVVRTGECTPYANLIIQSGVPF